MPPSFLTLGYQPHLPPNNYTEDSPITEQDTILMESEIHNADEILKLMYKIMAKK